jgi:hypothetical protein
MNIEGFFGVRLEAVTPPAHVKAVSLDTVAEGYERKAGTLQNIEGIFSTTIRSQERQTVAGMAINDRPALLAYAQRKALIGKF